MSKRTKIGDIVIRLEACRLAADALHAMDIDEGYTPRLWSLCVFFEMYLRGGAKATREEFGPKFSEALKVVK
jgi:hypothetical protein